MSVISGSFTSPIPKINLVGASRVVFKKGDIFLNGKRIHIDTTLSGTVRNINKKAAETGVRASIEKGSNGSARLVLTSKGNALTIHDPNKILLPFFKNNKMGRGADKFIQIISKAAISSNIVIRYTSQPVNKINAVEAKHLKLNEPEKAVKKQIRPNVVRNVMPVAAIINAAPAVAAVSPATTTTVVSSTSLPAAASASQSQPAAASSGWGNVAWKMAGSAYQKASRIASSVISAAMAPTEQDQFYT